MANSGDADQTPRSAASDLGLHCLIRPVCPNTESKYIHRLPLHVITRVRGGRGGGWSNMGGEGRLWAWGCGGGGRGGVYIK